MARPLRNTLADWVPIITILGVLTGITVGYTRLQSDVASSCKTFELTISRIEAEGTKVSIQNRQEIEVLKAHMMGITGSLTELKDGQKQMQRNINQLLAAPLRYPAAETP